MRLTQPGSPSLSLRTSLLRLKAIRAARRENLHPGMDIDCRSEPQLEVAVLNNRILTLVQRSGCNSIAPSIPG